MKNKAYIIMSMLIFGSIGLFVKNVNLSSLQIAFLRAAIGSIFLICASFVLKVKIDLKVIKQNLILLIASGVAIGFNWILLFEGYKYTTISNATISYYFAPIFVVILAPFILREKLTLSKICCVLLALVGLFMIVNTGVTVPQGSHNHFKGIMYGLSAASLYASVILINKFIKDLGSFETTIIQLMVAGVVLLPNIFLTHSFKLSGIDIKTGLLILVLGIIHTGIAYLLYFTSIKELESQSIVVLSYIDPISAVIMAAVFMGESMTFVQVVGGILILGATFLSERIRHT
jgi:drug/metabolite transporter (DMT)-like permease